MADVTLAELNGSVWLVGGELHIDDLLANTLPKDVTIELVPCERKSDVRKLWIQNCGEPGTAADPWLIHPAIVARIKRNSPDYPVFFAQWSILLDDDALQVIASAASWAQQNPDAPVLLAEYLDPAGLPAIEGLSRLRGQMIEDKLVEEGLPRERIIRRRRNIADIPGMGQESQRLDIIVRAS